MRAKSLWLTVGLLSLGQLVLGADNYNMDKAHSAVGFRIRHLVSQVPGRFTDFGGVVRVDAAHPETSTVEFAIKAASIDTDNDARDRDLRSANFFDVDRFPEITFKSLAVKPLGDNRFEVSGPLAIHGVTKQVTLPVSFLGFVKDPWGGERAGFEIETTLNRKDFGIIWYKVLDSGSMLLGDEVRVAINIEAVKEKPPVK